MSNEISRRSFLKGAAATAVSAALLGVTGSKAVIASAEGEAPEAQETWYDAKYFAKKRSRRMWWLSELATGVWLQQHLLWILVQSLLW